MTTPDLLQMYRFTDVQIGSMNEGGSVMEVGGLFLFLNSTLRAAFTPPLARPPATSFTPTLSFSHTAQQSGCCFVLLHKHSHRKGTENTLPLFTYYPPTPHMPPKGCTGAEKGISPHFLPRCFFLPQFHTTAHTHTCR